MAIIEVTVSDLQNASSKISQANETFREAAAALKAAADQLAGTWEGTSRDTFVQEQQEIDNWYKAMSEVVDQYVASMKNAAEQYESTDAEAAALIRKG